MTQVFFIWSVYFLAAATPGPSQFFILEKSLMNSRSEARWAALGVSLGTLLWVAIVTWGLGRLMTELPQSREALTLLSVLLLLYFAARNLRAIWVDRKKKPLSLDNVDSVLPKAVGRRRSSFLQGLLVNLLNPNSVVFFVSLFAPLMSGGIDASNVAISIAGVGVISVVWYQLIAEIWRFQKLYEFLQKNTRVMRALVAVFYLYWAAKLLV